MIASLASLVLLLHATTQPGPAVPPTTAQVVADAAGPAESLATAAAIVKAHGGDTWTGVSRIAFTFNVEAGGKLVLARKHDWNLRTGIDTITVGETTKRADLADTNSPGFAEWTNDSYWLLFPLKLLDGGVKFSPLASIRDLPASRGNMTISFANVGQTPGDQYDLSIDLKENRITHWTYRPNAAIAKGFTWDNYQNFNGLILSTEHKSDDGALRIFITDVVVERE